MKKLLLTCFSAAMIFALNTGWVHAEQDPNSTAATTETGESTEQGTTSQTPTDTITDTTTNNEDANETNNGSPNSANNPEESGEQKSQNISSGSSTSSSSSAATTDEQINQSAEDNVPSVSALQATASSEAGATKSVSDAPAVEATENDAQNYDAIYNGTNYTELRDAINAAITDLNNGSSESASETITVLRDVELQGAPDVIGGGTDDQAYAKVMITNGSLTIDFNGHSAIFGRYSGVAGAMGYPVVFNVSSGNLILTNGTLTGRPAMSQEEENELYQWMQAHNYFDRQALSGCDSISFWDQWIGDDMINGSRSLTLNHMKVSNISFRGGYKSDYQKNMTIISSDLEDCDFTDAPNTAFTNSKITGSKLASGWTPAGTYTFGQCYLKDNEMTFLGAAQFTDSLVENTLETNEEFQIWNSDLQQNEDRIGSSFDQVTLGTGNIGYEIQDDTQQLSAKTLDQMKEDAQRKQYLFVSSADLKVDWGDNKDHSKDEIDVIISYPDAAGPSTLSVQGNTADNGISTTVPDFTITGYDSFNLQKQPTNLDGIQVTYKMSDELKDLYDFNVEKQVDDNGHITIALAATKKTYTISYDPAGGIWEDGSQNVKTVSDAKDLAQTILPAPSRPGYKFLYWKGSQFNPGQEYNQTNTYGHYTDHQLTAVWEAVPSKSTGSTVTTRNFPAVKRFIPKTGAGITE